jgi:hypothetical protein
MRGSREDGQKSLSIQKMIRAYMTDTIWLTTLDVTTILEQLDDRVDHIVVSVTLIRLARKGELQTRKKRGAGEYPSFPVTQYRRVSA